MNPFGSAILHLYQAALRLYPREVYREYGEEMLAVFSESFEDNAKTSFWAGLSVAFWELFELPVSVLKEHASNLLGSRMSAKISSSTSFSRSILQKALVFGLSFALISLVYCLIDSILNAGRTFAEDITIWRTLYLHPTAVASAIGAFYLMLPVSRRKAGIAAAIAFVGYSVCSLAWHFLVSVPYDAYLSHGNWFYSLIVPLFAPGLIGAVIGGGIGGVLRGRKNAGSFALAGALGFILGWFLDRSAATGILFLSPYAGYLVRVVIGSFWYYLYWLIPTLLYGIAVGLFLGIAVGREKGFGGIVQAG